jgi:hypothetical protein
MIKFIEIEPKPADDVVDLLKNNVLGTPGKSMRYQQLRVIEKLDHINCPHFANIRKRDSIVGTCCFCERETGNDQKTLKSFYIRFFSFKEQYRKRTFNIKAGNKFNGRLKQEVKDLLEGHGLINNSSEAFFYAYVDPNNERSSRLCEEFGFIDLREFSTLSFSRFFPKKDTKVSRITKAEKPEVFELIKSEYKNHCLVSFENLFYKDNYYLLRNENGEILAGVQANLENWKIIEMPGISGKLILNLIPRIPLLKKLFNRDFNFVAFETIICKSGFENKLSTLFESILADLKVNSALFWVDNQSDIYKKLNSLDLGFISKVNKEVKAKVIGKFLNMNDNDINKIKNSPAYISSFDFT